MAQLGLQAERADIGPAVAGPPGGSAMIFYMYHRFSFQCTRVHVPYFFARHAVAPLK